MRKIPKLVKTCEHCGSEFRVDAWRVRQGAGKFCSKACKHTHGFSEESKAKSSLSHKRRWSDHLGRFKSMYSESSNGCWVWAGRLHRGYGHFKIDGVIHQAHRAAYLLYVGPIPNGKLVLHNCPEGDNSACVNPKHLFLGTHQDNMDDMRGKGRENYTGGPFGESHPSAKLGEAQVLQIRKMFNSKKDLTEQAEKMASEYGVHPQSVKAVIWRKTWKHI